MRLNHNDKGYKYRVAALYDIKINIVNPKL